MTTPASTDGALVGRILNALPQTQCTRCGYPDCAGYANAIAAGAADINQCPPGGEAGVIRLADITGRAAKPLNPEFGIEGPRTVAFIDENWCIGCTLCIDACPTDAIIGSNKRMHTVIEEFCTGCELCLPVCPVDCILLENASGEATGWAAWSPDLASTARSRYEFHSFRRTRNEAENAERLEDKARRKLADLPAHSQHTDPAMLDKKRAVIEAALERARKKREASGAP
ncbi:MAG: electron transport complex subunit RsxB [Rhodoferax sp.]|nr:electron transport complex subunit RsxB [Rhodoferax sp.]